MSNDDCRLKLTTFAVAYLALLSVSIIAHQVEAQTPLADKPRLVVGIVVDQMRQEYLYRFNPKFGEGGFRRLMNGGFILKNAHYNYAPTMTGPGHASIYTGTTPAIHGIIGNYWYDKSLKQGVYCVGDPTQKAIGSARGVGDVSPWRLQVTTITDELKLATQKKSKVVGLSWKDRGAVLPAGHMPDGAYWFDTGSGRFISSSYYMTKLPDWVDKFNQQNLAARYLAREWRTVYPIEQYVESGADDSPYEMRLLGKAKPVFPYTLTELKQRDDDYGLLTETPFADDLLTEMTKAALDGEQMGRDEIPDFLTVSYSTPDLVGHAMGPNSVEVEDIYIRLDRNIEDLLKFLDARVGRGNYLVFLTADHAAPDVAQYMKDNKIPAGIFGSGYSKARLNEYLKKYFPDREAIEVVDGEQIFFNHESFRRDPKSSGVELQMATELLIDHLVTLDGVANAYSRNTLREADYGEEGIKGMYVRSYHPKRSGDVVMTLEPGWYFADSVQGTEHGSPYRYDTHVPVLFYGKGVEKGSSVRYHSITDIAPTLSIMLNIKFPSGSTGQPIAEMFE